MARLIAQGLTSSLGHQVIVDNRGGGVLAIDVVVKAPPDGYTLLFYSSSIWILRLLQTMPYDPIRDLAPLTMVSQLAHDSRSTPVSNYQIDCGSDCIRKGKTGRT